MTPDMRNPTGISEKNMDPNARARITNAQPFDAALNAFSLKIEARNKAVFLSTAAKVHESITVGSATTGAPGQPVDTGFLRASWTLTNMPDGAEIATNVAYAPVIEHNLRTAYDAKGEKGPKRVNPDGSFRRPVKSTVGGHHSVKLTVSAADRLLAEAVRELGD